VRRATLIAPLLALAAAGGTSTAPVYAGDGPLDDARQAVERLDFSGTVQVVWSDGRGRHARTVAVEAVGGTVRVDGHIDVMATTSGRLVKDHRGWSQFWVGTPAGAATPSFAAKYSVAPGPSTSVAGRPARTLEVSTRGRLCERILLDDATGLLVGRQQLDELGSTVREVRYTSLRVEAPPSRPLPARFVVDAAAPLSATSLAAPYRAPARLIEGYQRLGVYRRDGAVHVLYGDGLYALSVFQQSGRLPGAPSRPTMQGWAGGQLMTWEDGPLVYTVVGDAPASEVARVAAAFPGPTPLSASQRILRSARVLVDVVSGRR
jgi:hypothetical protein